MQEVEENELTNTEQELRDILLNSVQMNHTPFTNENLQPDLVIKVKVPQKAYLNRKKQVKIGQFINNPPKYLINSYNSAYRALFTDMENVGDHIDQQNKKKTVTLRMRNQKCFENKKYEDNNNKVYENESQNFQQFTLKTEEEYNGTLDAFTIYFNTLIYVLQRLCGFHVKSMMVGNSINDDDKSNEQMSVSASIFSLFSNREAKREIYLFLSLGDENLFRAANRYSIKKEIDYAQLDTFLNQPTDRKKRPMKINRAFKQMFSKAGQKNSQHHLFKNKYIDRKLGSSTANTRDIAIIEEQILQQDEKNKFQKFTHDLHHYFQDLTGEEDEQNPFLKEDDQDRLTIEQENYLKLVNRGKINPGCKKMFVKLKKKRKFFDKIIQFCQKYEYKTYETPSLYGDFKIASKKKKFFVRLKSILFYKEHLVSPYGDLSLFNNMQKIKIAYFILKQFIRIQNLVNQETFVFVLNNKFEKFGELPTKIHNREQNKQIKGGLNGQNLADSWARLFLWQTNFKILRDYFGELVTFQIFLKSNLILFFMAITPFCLIMQVIVGFIVAPKTLPHLIVVAAYLLVIQIIYACFIEMYHNKEKKFVNNYEQTITLTTFRYHYKGPYIRNPITDSVNEFSIHKSFWTQLKEYIFLLIFLAIIGAEIGFYYACRGIIISASQQVGRQVAIGIDYIKPLHILGYSIFFLVNKAFSFFIIQPLANFLTGFENIPTQQAYTASKIRKLLVFEIGIQSIAPIDLCFIQNLTKTFCLNSCLDELFYYAATRYLIILFIGIVKLIPFLVHYCSSKIIDSFGDDTSLRLSYKQKLMQLVEYSVSESKKKKVETNTVNETIAMFHFCTFCINFPLGIAFSLLSLILDYFHERNSKLYQEQRPISKSEKIPIYFNTLMVLLHWMVFFNFSFFFINSGWFEYLLTDIVLSIAETPSVLDILTIKVMAILIFFFVYEVISWGVQALVSKRQSISEKRKNNKYKKLTETGGLMLSKDVKQIGRVFPMISIARTFNSVKINTEKEDPVSINKSTKKTNLSNKSKKSQKKTITGIDSEKSLKFGSEESLNSFVDQKKPSSKSKSNSMSLKSSKKKLL